ncbi:MAG: prepilin-type N-terminal cleavage/methylation domain-containing protein [Myxococcota bacterium]|nr:prepilin-type N-terminal cleavage/methylation domain-containing protein [Myxococcota bacterium]
MRGFTLLEVLAAVAILAIAYTTLGSSGLQGLQQEGEARRRLQASLLADATIAEIESAIEAGTAPPVGEEETESEDYRIQVSVEPFTLVVPEVEAGGGGKRLGNAQSRLGGERSSAQAAPGESLLGPSGAGRGGQSPLRRIAVRVVWDEGFGERVAARTTFALDGEAAAATIQALAQAAANAQDAAQPNNPLGGADPVDPAAREGGPP